MVIMIPIALLSPVSTGHTHGHSVTQPPRALDVNLSWKPSNYLNDTLKQSDRWKDSHCVEWQSWRADATDTHTHTHAHAQPCRLTVRVPNLVLLGAGNKWKHWGLAHGEDSPWAHGGVFPSCHQQLSPVLLIDHPIKWPTHFLIKRL